MKTLWLIPLSILLLAAGGYALCSSLGIDAHLTEMLCAAVVCCVAGELAMIPILLTKHAGQIAVSQAALVSTMIHLFFCTGVGGGLLLVKSLQMDDAIVYWLLAFYVVSLLIVVLGLVRAVRSAPMDPPVSATTASFKR